VRRVLDRLSALGTLPRREQLLGLLDAVAGVLQLRRQLRDPLADLTAPLAQCLSLVGDPVPVDVGVGGCEPLAKRLGLLAEFFDRRLALVSLVRRRLGLVAEVVGLRFDLRARARVVVGLPVRFVA